MKSRYSYLSKDENEKVIEGIQKFLLFAQSPQQTLKSIINEGARTLYRLFEFKEVVIGLYDFGDQHYKYQSFVGFRKDTELSLRRLKYTSAEFFNPKQYLGIWVSPLTKYFLAEDKPYSENEINSFNRPLALDESRRSSEEINEGDYIDVHLLTSKNQLLGWIELSNTKDGKLPSKTSIRWIELFAHLLTGIIQQYVKEDLSLLPTIKKTV